MPDPALPIPSGSIEQGAAVLYTREFRDPQGRPYSGRVTARRLTRPFLSTEAEVADGRVVLALEPGRYSIGAMVRDPDGVRAYIAEDVEVRGSDA